MNTTTFKHKYTDLNGHTSSEVEYTCHDDSLSELLQAFRLFLLAIGYHPDSVNQEIEPE
jgi:hypothetical protein